MLLKMAKHIIASYKVFGRLVFKLYLNLFVCYNILDMKTFVLIIMVFMDCADSQYPDCVNCPNGEWPRCDMF